VAKKTCEICGREGKPEDLVIYRIVPEEVAKQAGVIDLRTALLCFTCGSEIQDWYRKRVFNMIYDTLTLQFIPKSPTEIIKEYETAYKAFVAYKKAAVKL